MITFIEYFFDLVFELTSLFQYVSQMNTPYRLEKIDKLFGCNAPKT